MCLVQEIQNVEMLKKTMNNQILPRRDLRIEAFRKYEDYIARGCVASFYLDPQAELKYTPATFVARFRDAILAKTRFNYPSLLIPATFNLSNLEAQELTDGRVLIKNKTETEAIIIEEKKELCEKDIVSIMTDIATKKKLTHELSVKDGTELGYVLAWAAKHEDIDCMVIAQNGKAFFYTI